MTAAHGQGVGRDWLPPFYWYPCRYLVKEARALGLTVLDRCNLTVLLEPGQDDLASFLAENQVQVVASLPCYGQKNVDQQRGAGVFERSIAALQVGRHGMPWVGGFVKGLAWDALGWRICERLGVGCPGLAGL